MVSNRAKTAKEPPGERLLLSLLMMTRAVNIYNANNARMADTIDVFVGAIWEILSGADVATLRVHNGRFYLNRELVSCSPEIVGHITKLADYFERRQVKGLRFLEADSIEPRCVVGFVESLNRAEREKEPVAWLQARLAGDGYGWVEVLVDQDLELVSPDGGQGRGGAGTADGNGGKGRRRRKSRTQVLVASARNAYSQALTAMMSTVGKLPLQKRVSIQKTKRVIQNLIDILIEDESVLLGLGTIRDYDDYTYTHSVNVAILSMCLARRLGLSRAGIEQVGLCGLFHDLGKVDIPVELITKSSGLTPEEFELVKQHPLFSIRRIMRLDASHDMKAKFILPPLEHHLGVDLSGYPQTGRREPQSLLGRILAVVDLYDALTSNRSYRKRPYSPDAALRLMVEVSGSLLDPIILKAFIDMIGVYPVGSFLFLDTGEFGLVAEVPEGTELGRPFVVLLKREGDSFTAGDCVDLGERNDGGGGFRRNIVRSVHPSEYGIQPANFLL